MAPTGSENRADIAVIGAGPAGLMAAAAAGETDPAAGIALVDKNRDIGAKLLITGGGRCNVTTGLDDLRAVLAKYPRGGKFLTSAMHRFPPSAVREWFESRGVPLKTEADLRVFPRSNDGRDVVAVFERLFASSGRTRRFLGHGASGVRRTDGGFAIGLKDGGVVTARRLVLAAGGQAYRHTGSTGDGYAFAEALGHSITPLAPSLTSLTTADAWPRRLAGVSLTRARLKIAGGKKYEFTGPFVFGHQGVSGPAVFAMSSLIAFEKFDARDPLTLAIDLLPDISAEDLAASLWDSLSSEPKKNLANAAGLELPRSLIAEVCRLAGLDPDRPAGAFGKKEARRLAAAAKAAPIRITGRAAGEEFVTAGGVDTKDVDPATMESKICPGLYFAGELLNVDGFTGGFNLQACWATGHLAGQSAARSLAADVK